MSSWRITEKSVPYTPIPQASTMKRSGFNVPVTAKNPMGNVHPTQGVPIPEKSSTDTSQQSKQVPVWNTKEYIQRQYPGLWTALFIIASAVNKPEQLVHFEFVFCHAFKERFICSTCRKHIEEYLRHTTPRDPRYQRFDSYGNYHGARLFILDFYNAVAKRLGKPIMIVEDFYLRFPVNIENLHECEVDKECGE